MSASLARSGRRAGARDVPVVSQRAAASLFLERQHLRQPRARKLSAARLVRFIEDVGGLQIDSINVIDRAHYLTVWSRFGAYDRRALDRIAYLRRLLFEYWAHAACFVSTTHFPNWRRAMLDYETRYRSWGKWLKKNRRLLAAVEQSIRENGPQGTSHFEHKPGTTGGWWNWKPAAHALDFLWMTGRTLVHSRDHFQKRYDLAERLMPEALRKSAPSQEVFLRWHIRRSLHAMGAATEGDLGRYLTFPRFPTGARRKAVKDMVSGGEIRELGVKGSTARWLCLAEDVPALARAGRRRQASNGTTFLSPFDSLMWHRDRVERLFGFDYRIEVYVPKPKRVHGYYVLPVLHDGHFIGRADLKVHRDEGRLELKRIGFEPWFANGGNPPGASWGDIDRAAALTGVADALRSLATFVGAGTISVGRVAPSRLARDVRQAVSE